MKDNKTGRILNLLLYLGSKPYSTKKEILQKQGLDERTFFNYLREIREAGFLLKCKSGKYFLEKTNENVRIFSDIINFSKEEEHIISSAIGSLNLSANKKNKLFKKLSFLHDNSNTKNTKNNKTAKLTESAQNKKQVLIEGYHIDNIEEKRFTCEVYAFDNDLQHCWCYIHAIQNNIKLKISDIPRVSISPLKWIYKEKHLNIECDSLGDYGIKNMTVNIFLNKSGANNLINQFPLSAKHIKKIDIQTYQYKTYICSYDTITKFILFNTDDIFEINTYDLKSYISDLLIATTKTISNKIYTTYSSI